jgi:microcystin-dependent protein
MEVNDLLAAAETIKNENSINKNSSNRIGVMLENMINFFSTTISPAAAALIQDAVSKSTTGVRKGMSVVWSGAIAEIPAGYVLSNGNNGQPINGVVVPDYRSRFLIGYDSSKAALPASAIDVTENYGKGGNTGGANSVSLIAAQNGAHDHKMFSITSGINNTELADWPNARAAVRVTGNINGDDNNCYVLKAVDTIPTAGVTSTSGSGQAHENRPPYYVVYWITKVSDDTTAEYNSAYQSYKATTTDVPIKTEAEWVASLKGDSALNSESILYLNVSSENINIPIPGNTWIKDINIFVESGDPTTSIPLINTGDMNGQDLYPNSANIKFSDPGFLQINVSGGTIKIQIIKYNI